MLKNSLFNALAGVASLGTALVSGIIVARLLGVDTTGAVNFTVWAATAALVVFDLGIPSTLWRFIPALRAGEGVPQAEAMRDGLFRTYTRSVGVVVAILVCVSVWQGVSSGGETAALWAAGTGLFATYAAAVFCLNELRGFERFQDIALLSTATVALQLPLVAIGAYTLGAGGAVMGYIAGQVPLAIACLRHVSLRGRAARRTRPEVRTYAVNTWIGNVIDLLVWSRLEFLFLGYFIGADAVAIFSVGLVISNLAVQLPLQLAGPLLPHFAARYTTGDKDRLRDNYTSAVRIMAFLVLPACLGAVAITPTFIPLVYGAPFAPAVTPSVVLLLAAVLPALSDVPNALIYAAGHSRFFIFLGLAGAAGMLASGFLIIPAYGVAGAAWARLAIHFALAIVTFIYAGRTLDQTIPRLHLAAIGTSAAVCAIAAYVVCALVGGGAGIVLAIATGVIVYCLFIRALRGLPKEDVERFLPVTQWLPSRLREPGRALLLALSR